MPDRILRAAEALRGEAESLHTDAMAFKRSQRWKNLLGFALLVAVAVLSFVFWRDSKNDARLSCESRNETRAAIVEAFGNLPDIGDKFLEPDDPVQVELERADRELRAELAPLDC